MIEEVNKEQKIEQNEHEEIIEEPKIESKVSIEEKPSKLKILFEWKNKIKEFIVEAKRVLIVTKKPDREEYKTILKISGVGTLIIGLIGFIIHLFKELLF